MHSEFTPACNANHSGGTQTLVGMRLELLSECIRKRTSRCIQSAWQYAPRFFWRGQLGVHADMHSHSIATDAGNPLSTLRRDCVTTQCEDAPRMIGIQFRMHLEPMLQCLELWILTAFWHAFEVHHTMDPECISMASLAAFRHGLWVYSCMASDCILTWTVRTLAFLHVDF